jgi:AraC family transcriptional regulator
MLDVEPAAMDYDLASKWGIRASPTVCASHYGQPRVSIARLQSEGPDPQLIHLLPPQHGYLLSIHLQPLWLPELRVGARQLHTEPWGIGTITLANLQDEPRASRGSSLDALLAHLPQAAFDDLAHEHDLSVSMIDVPWGTRDPIVASLGACLLPAFTAPEETSGLFVDQLVLTLLIHLRQRYGGSALLHRDTRAGTLAPWQLRARSR